MKLDFLITNTDTEIQIRWHMSLGKINSSVYRTLEAALESVDGVEAVRMQRYSCMIALATHVTQAATAVKEIADILSDAASEFRVQLRFLAPDLDVTVTPAGKTVRLVP